MACILYGSHVGSLFKVEFGCVAWLLQNRKWLSQRRHGVANMDAQMPIRLAESELAELVTSGSSDPVEPFTPPKDRFGLAYNAFFLAGAGFLFPWNSFVAAVDYFLFLYPDKH